MRRWFAFGMVLMVLITSGVSLGRWFSPHFIWIALMVGAFLLERRYRYTRRPKMEGLEDFTPTGESFRDSETDKWLWVWYNERTGERRYLPIDRPLN